jgi:hypothetical protein
MYRARGVAGSAHMAMAVGPIDQVSTTSVRLRDISGPDPWVPEAGARGLMVTLW